MLHRLHTIGLCLALLLIQPVVSTAAQPAADAPTASFVLGQATLESSTPGDGLATLNTPGDVAVDAATDTLYVLDTGNQRVLRWNTVSAAESGAAADAVFGRPCTAGPAADCLFGPTQLVVDDQGILWVADAAAGRIVGFPDAAFSASDTPATYVLGADSLAETGSLALRAIFTGNGLFYVLTDEQLLSWATTDLTVDGALPLEQRWSTDVNVVSGTVDPFSGGIWLLAADQVPATWTDFGAIAYLAPGDEPDSPSAVLPWRPGTVIPGQPPRLLITPDGNLLLSDPATQQVSVFLRVIERVSWVVTPIEGRSGVVPDRIYGQSDTCSVSAAGLCAPAGVAYTTDGPYLYVADSGNHRVVRYEVASFEEEDDPWPELPPQPADFVVGQPDLTSGEAGSGPAQLNTPLDVALHQPSDTLFVLDAGNRRVLRWRDASALEPGAAADAVFGGDCGVDLRADCLLEPRALAVDAQGGLWVADTAAQRLLYFADATTAASGSPASVVLGSDSFERNGDHAFSAVFLDETTLYALTEDALYRWPYAPLPASGSSPTETRWFDARRAVAGSTDPAGGLWLAMVQPDTAQAPREPSSERNSVYYYASADDLDNPAGVLGWRPGDLSDAPSLWQFVQVQRIAVAKDGTLFVSDSGGHRVMAYYIATERAATHLANGGAGWAVGADLFFGQSTWISAECGLAADALCNPHGVAFDEPRGRLYLADTQNNRVLRIPHRYLTTPVDGDPEAMDSTAAGMSAAPRDCATLPDFAVAPERIELGAGGSAQIDIAVRNIGTTPHGYNDIVVSLSDGLQVTDAPGMTNLGQRAAVQRNAIAPGETVRYRVTVSASAALPTAPLFVVEHYCGGRVVQRIDGAFAAPAEPPATPEPAARPAPLPAVLPATGEATPWPVVALTAALLSLLGGLAVRVRR